MLKKYFLRCYLHFKFYFRNRISNSNNEDFISEPVRIGTNYRFSRLPYLFLVNDELVIVYYAYTMDKGWQIAIQDEFGHAKILADDMECMAPSGIIVGDEILLVCHAGKMPNRKLKLISYNYTTSVHKHKVINTRIGHGDINYPCLLKGSDGFTLFFSVKNGKHFSNYMVTTTNLENWSKPERLDFIGDLGRRMNCILSNDGTFHMTWEEEEQIKYASSNNGKDWGDIYIVDPYGNRPKVALVEKRLVISYAQHDKIHSIKIAVFEKEKWKSRILLAGKEYITRPSNTIAQKGKSIVAWSKITALKEEIYHIELDLLPE